MLGLLLFFFAPGMSKNIDDLAAVSDSCSNKAHLTIVSTPEGAAININGQFLGRTPIQNHCLDVGDHLLLGLNPDRTHWAAADWLQKISVRPGDSLYFSIDFKALTENGCAEAVGGRSLAQELSNGSSSKLGKQVLNNVQLQEESWQLPNSRSGQKAGAAKSWKKIALVTFVGAAIFSGLASVHFRDQANAFYASYQKSGQPDQMDHYFDKTQYYDRVSGICYGIFQVSFMTTLYFYLSSNSK